MSMKSLFRSYRIKSAQVAQQCMGPLYKHYFPLQLILKSNLKATLFFFLNVSKTQWRQQVEKSHLSKLTHVKERRVERNARKRRKGRAYTEMSGANHLKCTSVSYQLHWKLTGRHLVIFFQYLFERLIC